MYLLSTREFQAIFMETNLKDDIACCSTCGFGYLIYSQKDVSINPIISCYVGAAGEWDF